MPSVCLAQVNWTGATNNDWHTAGNWVGGVVPGAGEQVVIDDSVVTSGMAVDAPTAGITSLTFTSDISADISIGGIDAITIGNNAGGYVTSQSPHNTVVHAGITLNNGFGGWTTFDLQSGDMALHDNVTEADVCGLLKEGTGKLAISAAAGYTGATSVQAGTLEIGSTMASQAYTVSSDSALTTLADHLLDSSAAPEMTVDGTLTLQGSDTVSLLEGASTGVVSIAANETLVVSGPGNYAGNLTGDGNIEYNTPGLTSILSGDNSGLTGVLTIKGGYVNFASAESMGGSKVVMEGGFVRFSGAGDTYDRNIELVAGSNKYIHCDNDVTYSGHFFGDNNTVATRGPGTLTLTGNNAAGFGGYFEIDQGTLVVSNTMHLGGGVIFDGGDFHVTGSDTVENSGLLVLNDHGTVTVDSSATFSQADSIIGNNNLTKNGGGTMRISDSSNYGGRTIVNAGVLDLAAACTNTTHVDIVGGTVRISGAGDVLSQTCIVDLADNANAMLDLADQDEDIGQLTGGGPNGGNVELGSGRLGVIVGNNNTFGGIINGTGGFALAGGTMTLSRNNTYTGTTTVYDACTLNLSGTSLSGALDIDGTGTLVTASADNQLLGTPTVDLDAGATLTLGGSETLGGLAGGGNLQLANGSTLTLAGGGAYSGDISGDADVVINHGGTSTFSTANSFTGKLAINSGTLSIANISALGSGGAQNTLQLGGGTL
ncbi:MAG: beta strand repeat-containing protein, partial [Phycisphaerae bacterium]